MLLDAVTAWQARPLEATDAVVFFDALRVTIRDEGRVRNKAVYLALGIPPSGPREVLGLWTEQSVGGVLFSLTSQRDLQRRIAQIEEVRPVRGHH